MDPTGTAKPDDKPNGTEGDGNHGNQQAANHEEWPITPVHNENVLQKYIMGDLQVLNDWFSDKPVAFQFPNWMLRAIGAPIFLNNPISGILILTGMFIHNPWVAINALLGLITAIVTALALNLNRGDIASGGATFHGMLVGIVLTSTIDRPDWYPWVLFPVIFMASLSVFLASGLGTIFGKWNLPAFNLPFVVAAFVFIAAAQYTENNPHFPIKKPKALSKSELFGQADLDWRKVWSPILLAGAQIYGSDNWVLGGLVLAAQFVASPVIAIHAVLASVLSVLTAIAMAAPPQQIYDGTWSYNAMLTCTALGGFFFVLTVRSHIVALFSAIFATVTFGAIGALLKPVGLPIIAFPFVISASIFLSVTSQSRTLKRVPLDNLSYPEKHRRLYKSNTISDTNSPA